MKNKNVGFLIIGIAVVIGIIILVFNIGMKDIVSQSCSHGPECTMYDTIAMQTGISLAVAALVLFIGLFFVLSKENERIVIKKIKPEAKLYPKKFDKKSIEKLEDDEKRVMNLLLEHNGSIYQSKISEFLDINKVQVTRILDSLEAQDLVERKRRGMTNIVLLR